MKIKLLYFEKQEKAKAYVNQLKEMSNRINIKCCIYTD